MLANAAVPNPFPSPGTGAAITSTGKVVTPHKLLVRSVNWLGDAVMTTPALQRLRQALPHAHLTLLTHEKLTDLWKYHPSIDALLTFASGEWPSSIARRLREQEFDTALVLPNSPRSALESWLAGIPRRIGYARPWRNWFLSQIVSARPAYVRIHKRSTGEIRRLVSGAVPQPSTGAAQFSSGSLSAHQTHEYLHLASALGASPEPLPPHLEVRSDEIEAVALKFGLRNLSGGDLPVFGLHPGAEYGPAKRWPLDRFVAAALEIRKRTGCAWLLLGGPSDSPAADAIHAALLGASRSDADSRGTQHSTTRPAPASTHYNLSGKTTLRELMALLKLCRVLLSNDTGPMHVAAALGTPVVVPFGSTSPELTGPGLPGDSRHRLLKSDAPCAPCFRRACPIDFRCMTGIPVERVVDAVLQAASPG